MRLLPCLTIGLFLIVSGNYAAGALPVFTNRFDLPLSFPTGSQFADVTDDGEKEIVTRSSIFALSTNGHLSNVFNFANPADVFAVGDLDGDGSADLLRDRETWRGLGDGTFSYVTNVHSVTIPEWFPSRVELGDFDGNGKRDACYIFFGQVEVWTNSGNGLLNHATTTSISNGFETLCAADFNGDGVTDLALENQGVSSHVQVRLGTSAGAFGPPLFYPVSSESHDFLTLTTSDLNADGFADLIVGALYGTNVTVLMGTNGGFTGPRHFANDRMSYGPAAEPPLSLHVTDWDGDGHEDVMTYFAGNTRAWFLAGRGNGEFAPGAEVWLPPNHFGDLNENLLSIDLNRDGRMDLIRQYREGPQTSRLAFLANITVGTTNPPVLEIERTGSSLRLSWLREGFGFFRLQYAANIATTNIWKNVTTVRRAGPRSYITNDTAAGTAIFRLRQE